MLFILFSFISLLVCNQYSATNTRIASEFCDYFYR
ncbi:hypothetical protein CHD5UKE2_013 [Escherichia phage vB_EcoS-CHD5UKE2]|uniref:Uncharacterized protein n=1 Tax=Escherichia phage vB_EcoS-CHD5UKE2 TaxID=2865806 RepID=A0A9E7MKR1_9CAUD|nr:hypothetical protein P9604_gp12 [Escherichia phage vB_EcoS-CHD5UKE2]USL86338.1 hypothetical protein CHD5UKE2_013 [Escherichia phage vB_EcoS-CHD5UKE2]